MTALRASKNISIEIQAMGARMMPSLIVSTPQTQPQTHRAGQLIGISCHLMSTRAYLQNMTTTTHHEEYRECVGM